MILVIAALALGGSLQLYQNSATLPVGTSQADNQVYTLDQVLTGLAQSPTSWIGRTVRISAVLQGPFVFCGRANPCPAPLLGLVDDGNGILGAGQYLPVERGTSSGTQPALRFNVPSTFRVALRASTSACSLNPDLLCYIGTLQSTGA